MTTMTQAPPSAPTCEAKLRQLDSARDNFPAYCRRSVALGSFVDANGVRRFHCQEEGHRAKVVQLYGEFAVAVFDAPRCRFCKRTAPILDGTYTRIRFPDGIALVCDDCYEKRDEPDDEAHLDGGRFGDIAVEIV